MATAAKLQAQLPQIVHTVYARLNEADSNRQREHKAAVKIQSWYRKLRTGAYIRHLNNCALVIQRYFRGFLGRKAFRIFLKQKVFMMRRNEYNAMAAKIQKTWQGFYARKYVFDYYAFKRYLNALQVKNENVRNDLADYKEQQEMTHQIKEQKAQKQQRDEWLRKHHYLVSTAVVPSIYNSPYRAYPQEVEFELRRAKVASADSPGKASREYVLDPSAARYDLPVPRPNSLPPLPKRPQGPFKEPAVVRAQRYKPFKPTLRVETSYASVEEAREAMRRNEWLTRLIDTPFVPFSRRHREYEPLHHTSTEYGDLPYGNAYFREEFPEHFASKGNFKTVVPPIPIFEHLNSTYSQGQA